MATKYFPPNSNSPLDNHNDIQTNSFVKKLKNNEAVKNMSKDEFVDMFRNRKRSVVEILRIWMKDDPNKNKEQNL